MADQTGRRRYWAGRGGRAEFWTAVGTLFAINLLLGLLHLRAISSGISFIIYARRLHDIGRSLWWYTLTFCIVVLLMVFGVIWSGQAFLRLMSDPHHVIHGLPPTPYILGILAGGLIHIGFTIWLGLQKGDEGENRFGPPPAKKMAKPPSATPPAPPSGPNGGPKSTPPVFGAARTSFGRRNL